MESYSFTSTEANETVITINLTYPDAYHEMISEMWDKGHEHLKETLENL